MIVGKIRIHRIIATAFIPNPDNLPEINHIDGVKDNNNVNNLEWVSHRDNMIHAAKLRPKTDNRSKKVEMIDERGKCLQTFKSISEASRESKVCNDTVSYHCKHEDMRSVRRFRFA